MGSVSKSDRSICIIHPNKNSYSETFIHNHIKYLPAKVHVLYQLENLTHQGNDEKPLVPRAARIASRWYSALCGYLKSSSRIPHDKKLDRVATFFLTSFLKSGKVDAVLAEYGPTGVAVMDACRSARVPLIVHFHGFDAHSNFVLEPYALFYQEMFSYARAIVAVSQSMKEQLLQMGAPPEKVHYNAYGVNTDQFKETHPDKNPPVFIAVGRFVDKKAPHLTLLAFRKVLNKCSSARLRMIADGPLLEACRHIVSALRMAHAVEFLGPQKHSEVAQAMQRAKSLVQHSVTTSYGDSEGTPLVILEAGASGLPVVSTRHAGIRDVVVENKTGFLVDEYDIDGMADHMIQLIEKPELVRELGVRARAHIKNNYSMQKSIESLWKIILNCINKR